MKKRKDVAQQVQEQINKSATDLGRVRKRGPQGIRFSSDKFPEYELVDVSYKARSFTTAPLGRCVFYSPILSGRGERDPYSGWCTLVSGSAHDGRIESEAAYANWLRESAGVVVGCQFGKFSTDFGFSATCSGFSYRKFYVPTLNDFRTTSENVWVRDVPSYKGNFQEAAQASGYASMYSFEVFKKTPGPVYMSVSCPDSFGIYASGHLRYTSGNQAPNFANKISLSPPTNQWVRYDIVHYVPEGSPGALSIGGDFADFLDGWRIPTVPSGVQAYYGTFAKKDPGAGPAKWSYIHAQIGIPRDTTVLGQDNIDSVDIDWRAPHVFNAYRRITYPIGTTTATVSGIWRVPGSEDVEIRARAVNVFGDPGPWHAVSGIVSAASNVKETVEPASGLIMTRGVGKLEFEVTNSRWGDEYILLSGGTHNHTLDSDALQATATIGDMSVTTLGTMSATVSGHMVAFGTTSSAAYVNAGESHIITAIDGSTVYLDSPITKTLSAPGTNLFVYRVAKVSPSSKFSLLMGDTADWYFNVGVRNFNGAIGNLVSGIAKWPHGHVSVTVNNELFDEGLGVGKNFILNGSFESPGYIISGGTSSQYYGVPWQIRPMDYWYTPSGGLYFPAIHNYYNTDGVQSIIWGNAYTHPDLLGYSINEEDYIVHAYNLHNGAYQDIYELAPDTNYRFKGDVDAQVTGVDGEYPLSGMVSVYHEIWEYDRSEILGIDFQYGENAPSLAFVSSGTYDKVVSFRSAWAADNTVFPSGNKMFSDIQIPELTAGYTPMLRLAVYIDGQRIFDDMPTEFRGFSSTYQFVTYRVDSVSLSKRFKVESHIADSHIQGQSLNWGTVRLNRLSHTDQGDHLNVDFREGFGVHRRLGNPKPVYHERLLSSLEQYPTSGFLEIPRLIWYHPAAVPGVDSIGSSYSTSDYLLNGLLRVPSGKALMFDITPRRTFLAGSDTEIVSAGSNQFSWFIPSGGSYFTGPGYWDPGMHGLGQIIDIEYTTLNPFSSGNRISRKPIVAAWGDIDVVTLSLSASTYIAVPGSSTTPSAVWPLYWHVCDVKIWEIGAKFIASGVSGAGNNIGASEQYSLPYFSNPSTTSIFRRLP